LWDPSAVDLGAIGYLSKPRGAFITLFNALHPNRSSLEAVRAIPGIDGYGRVTNEGQRVSKRNPFIDTIMGLLTIKNKSNGDIPYVFQIRECKINDLTAVDCDSSQPVNRRYMFPLKTGHRAAFLCAETTEYRYLISEEGGQLDAPKRWFKANVDTIMKIYGAQHQIQREELCLGTSRNEASMNPEFDLHKSVVGTLRTPNYALFVSHNHPEGHVSHPRFLFTVPFVYL
jgi:hypothetical protein